MNESQNQPPSSPTPSTGKPKGLLIGLLLVTMVVTFGATALLVNIFEHKQEAQRPFVRLVEVDEATSDPVPWGTNWPYQFDTYKRSVDSTDTTHGGSSALSASKLEQYPWLKRLYAGYAFSIDYRELRGHAYMLYDQEVTQRVTNRSQGGACLHCHSSIIPTYRRLGLEAMGKDASPEAIAADFNWPAVLEGFKIASAMSYADAHAELLDTPDGTPHESIPLFPGGALEQSANQPVEQDPHNIGNAHPVSCVDCHDPDTMKLRVTRPGFILGVAALAESDDPVPHLPSIERWREGPRSKPYDPNIDASRHEMRSFSCAQCHVEYYCASKETLFFPWENGLKVEQMEETYENHTFPDGSRFLDYKHAETGAPIYKAQHPEFELWSQGIHARSGVSCTDCHMPYERQGATKVSNHWVRSPMLNVNNACQTCHNVPESELVEKVDTIQNRTKSLMARAANAMTDMLDAIREAQAAGASEAELEPILELQRKAMWRLDYISSENSLGFHADQEAARILGESIDYSRQAQSAALRYRAPEAPSLPDPGNQVEGITPGK
ncbi:ammonia-forming cytochrome c nitrite reductase subunit c552 [Pelagicoccus sp. SDUM812003]|uniref:ammonia-forming cytochrome c nitrite reductase subunit c552 n=1 Tax=Pelagicoccus sp. SDUM812003 TaxID=3041267 RepID=UPI0028108B9F|nr:ammonia-forming cytochrome c nitrite reductase subunit c552 [Pelagicoccus sp. SDUM812003]MDQ8204494.1 ammonia-forming cytochrome c nitrite reductase subunit c552 [Pelagicoccus sp. SDUM812003]